jgi:hypothetical protein
MQWMRETRSQQGIVKKQKRKRWPWNEKKKEKKKILKIKRRKKEGLIQIEEICNL